MRFQPGCAALATLILAANAAACTELKEPVGQASDGGADASTHSASSDNAELGLNDVSILLPLQAAREWPVFGTADLLVPPSLIRRLAEDPTRPSALSEADYASLRVVAVRFDLCDRRETGPCSSDAFGSIRLVVQPLHPVEGAADIALHAFYEVPSRDVPALVDDLKRAGSGPGPLTVSPSLLHQAQASAYLADLKRRVLRFCSPDSLVRLTFFSIEPSTERVRWNFAGLERSAAGRFVDMRVADTTTYSQRVEALPGAGGRVSFALTPEADRPVGTSLILDESAFLSASAQRQTQAMDALARVDNPKLETAETVQCASCHISTFLLAHRAELVNYDTGASPSRFQSDLSLTTDGGRARKNSGSLRAFGWLGQEPMISQRVVNESANVVSEMRRRRP